jgi:hypothetical protein
MMYSMVVGAQSNRDRCMADAELDRTARAVRAQQEPETERPWRGRLQRNVMRRLARVGGAA